MLRRLLLVLCLALGGLTAATPALAQRNEAELRTILDSLVAASQPAQDGIIASTDLLGMLLDAAGQANTVGIEEAWLADWSAKVDRQVAAVEAILPRLAPMTSAEIQRRSLGYAQYKDGLQRMNQVRGGLLESSRQAIFFAREAQVQAAKAAKGDDKARERLVRIGVSSTRLTLEAQMAAVDGALTTMPANHPQKPLAETAQANNRAAVEIYKLLERRLSGAPLDAAATAERIRGHVAEARRQALLIDPAVQFQIREMAGSGAPAAVTAKVKAVMLSFGDSTQTELRIANLLDDSARRIQTNVEDPGDDAWGLDLTLPLVEKRISDHLARVKMVQDF